MTSFHGRSEPHREPDEQPASKGPLGPNERHVSFWTRHGDGIVHVDLMPDGHFGDVFNDTIGSVPAKGEPTAGPSTTFIDEALSRIERARSSGDTEWLMWGNISRFRLVGEQVEASYDFDEEDDPPSKMPVAEFVSILRRFREVVLISQRTATASVPDVYRANGYG